MLETKQSDTTQSHDTTRRPQQTLAGEVSFSGIGVHTGLDVTMTFLPAPEGTGRVFRRTDLPGKPEIPATLEYVLDTNRSTTIGVGSALVKTVEHVLAALSANHIDNVYIEVSAEEPPIGNGSADVFVDMIHQAGIETQQQPAPVITVTKPVYFSHGDIHVVALPAENFQISYTLSYPQSPVLQAQYQSLVITPESFRNEIAPCRTFSLYEEISPLLDRGLIKGGSLSNSVVIKDDVVFSKEGLFFSDEMARHKILDVIGDLSLIGYDLQAHVIAIRSGHHANCEFAKRLYQNIRKEDTDVCTSI